MPRLVPEAQRNGQEGPSLPQMTDGHLVSVVVALLAAIVVLTDSQFLSNCKARSNCGSFPSSPSLTCDSGDVSLGFSPFFGVSSCGAVSFLIGVLNVPFLLLK